jgi:hypothetical protein
LAKKTITGSPNIATLESKIVADICAGKFYVDITPSVFIGAGADNVLGAKVKLINPYGVTIKDFGVGYDIEPPMDASYEFSIPTQSGNYQYGTYTYEVELTDAGNVKTIVTDTIDIAAPNRKNKAKLYGDIAAEINGSCKDGKVTIIVAEPPTYKGVMAESKTQSFTLTYPSSSLLPPLITQFPSFSVALFEGVYKIVGDICVTYNLGSNKYVNVPYKVNCSKNILCTVDLCTVFSNLEALNAQLNDSCSIDQKNEIANITIDALRLLKTIELGSACGEDVSEYIEQLEKLLGCKCSCSTNEGTPIINNAPAKDFNITGCNVTKETVGLTDNYTIDNYSYVVAVNPAANFLTVSAGVLDGCVVTQTLSFDVSALYVSVKALIVNDTEYNFWGSVINNTINTLDAGLLLCLGYTNEAWNALTFRQKWIALVTKLCSLASGGICAATISGDEAEAVLGTTVISWTNVSGVFIVDIYVDNNFVDSVAAPLNSYALSGFNDGMEHTYKLVAKCDTGIFGNVLEGEFISAGCAFVAPPNPSDVTIADAECPYDLTALLAEPPVGYTYEWHNANNTLNTTLISGTGVTSGTYYAFAKETATGCFSAGVAVVVTCEVAGNCTEPLALTVVNSGGGAFVSFSSAAIAPPSYLVKRRLASDPDVGASYTTIGAPVFNAGTNKWEILDNTLTANTLYVYMAESQCTDASRPNSQYNFAKITCPVVTISAITGTSFDYSFPDLGGGVTQYVVRLLDATGLTVLQTNTINPAFTNPVTGSFTGLSGSTSYKIYVEVKIGSYTQSCATQNVSTDGLTGRLLTVGYISGQFVATLDGAFATELELTDFEVGGYTDGSCTTKDEDDTLTLPLTLAVGDLVEPLAGVSPLTVASTRYRMENFGYVNGIPVVDGDLITIGGQHLSITIDPLTCEVYTP